jgi:predicted alpha/beta hydrolase
MARSVGACPSAPSSESAFRFPRSTATTWRRRPPGGATALARTAVLVNCGGGIPAYRYARFARFLAANGFPVVTYDYRGIGQSRPASLRGLASGNEDWSEYDCGGAIAEVRRRYPTPEIVAVAHSFGTFLVGGAPNVAEIRRFVFIGAHTGYVGDYLRRYRLPMALVWHGVMPAITRAVGYFPGRALRLGDDIPRAVALQWSKRRTPELQAKHGVDVTRTRAWIARHDPVKGRVLVIGIADDAFATEQGARRLLALYPGLRATHERVAPAEVGLKRIGHFGFFRRGGRLWPPRCFLREGPAGGAGRVRSVLQRKPTIDTRCCEREGDVVVTWRAQAHARPAGRRRARSQRAAPHHEDGVSRDLTARGRHVPIR